MLLAGMLGCDDPTGVGLELVGENSGDPVRVYLTPTAFESYDSRKVTGAVRGPSAFSGQVGSTLIGRVDDPVFGERAAQGYIDFQLSNFLQSFADQAVTSAEIRLVQTYRYGDTTAVNTLRLFEMPEPWDPAGAPSDTTFAFGEPIIEVNYRATDSLIVVPLPEAWIEKYDATLRSEDFNEAFHGFHMQADPAAAVSGFSAVSSTFRMTTASDTLSLNVSRVFTHIDLLRAPEPLAERVLVEDGLGEGVSLDLGFDPDSLADGALSRAVLRVRADTTLFDLEEPLGFVRPILLQLNLYGITPDGERRFLLSALRNANGEYVFQSIDLITEVTFIRSFQQLLYGDPMFDRYVLLPPETASSVSVLPLYGLDTGEEQPELILTVVPLQ